MCSINHDKKAIYIHIPKTAGIYIRSTLDKYYNFKLFLFERPDHIEYCKTNLSINKEKQLFFGNNIHGIINYYKTSKYLSDLMGMNDEKWDSYYKFCFIRNPYDRIVSAWNYIQETNNYNIDFDKYLEFKNIVDENEYFHVFLNQYKHMINENNEFYINFVGKFENLEEDFKTILLNIGFKDEEIIHDKSNKINKRKHEKFNILINNQNILNTINNICELDLEKLHYKKIENIDELKD
jgi:hypothetical protein